MPVKSRRKFSVNVLCASAAVTAVRSRLRVPGMHWSLRIDPTMGAHPSVAADAGSALQRVPKPDDNAEQDRRSNPYSSDEWIPHCASYRSRSAARLGVRFMPIDTRRPTPLNAVEKFHADLKPRTRDRTATAAFLGVERQEQVEVVRQGAFAGDRRPASRNIGQAALAQRIGPGHADPTQPNMRSGLP